MNVLPLNPPPKGETSIQKLIFKPFSFQLCSWIIFLLITIYLLLRAAFVEPLHDESATFLFFIEPESVIGQGIVQDANNHLLNSFLGTAIYHFFGENFFLFRLPNVLSFALYFWGVYTLVKPINRFYFKFILLTAMVTVPYMNDYFAYTRGYGLGISFFVWMLIYSQKWLNENTLRNAAILYLFSLLAIFSNLIFMVSGCLAMGMICLVHLQEIRNWKRKKQACMFCLHFLFLLGLYPFVWFSYMLKMGGALYYGSLDGFWKVTGKTLSRYVLFYDADWQQWLWFILILFLAVFLIYRFVKKGFWMQLKAETTIFSWYFFGNVAAIFMLAKIFQVNYPEDRAAMYFIPLALLIFGFLIWKSTQLRPTIFLLLFFPITFLVKLNLHTSIFTPDDRVSKEFYAAVRRKLKPETTLAIYHTMNLNWAMKERNCSGVKVQPNISKDFSPLYDIFMNKKSLIQSADLKDYELVFDDKPGGNVAYRRKIPLERELLTNYRIPEIKSQKDTVSLLELDVSNRRLKQNLIVMLNGKLNIDKTFRTVQFLIETYNSKGEEIRSQYFDQRWPHGKNQLHFTVKINHVLSTLSSEETKLRLYIWNPEHHVLGLENGEIQLYKIKI